MSSQVLKLYPQVQFFPIYTDTQKCVFISAEKKKVLVFFAHIFSFSITSIFSKGQLNLFG